MLLVGQLRLAGQKNDKKHIISVIVAVHNEENNLRRCLESLTLQTYPAGDYEVIIADDRSTDATPEIIDDFCTADNRFKKIRIDAGESVIPKKTALKKALDCACGEIIASTDGDCEVPTTWLSTLNGYFTDKVGMVIGHTHYHPPRNFWQGIDALDYFSQRALGTAFVGIGSAYTCTASNMAYRKEIYLQNRDAFNALKIRPAEDNFFLQCVHHNSRFSIAVATGPGSYITTGGASSFNHYMNQRFRWAAYGDTIATPVIRLFFMQLLCFNLLILALATAVPFTPHGPVLLAAALGLKCIVDFLFIAPSARLFNCCALLKYFLPLSIAHIVMIPLIVIKGNLSVFEWKGRRYTSSKSLGAA
jgi:cellulose synthase/poly-beta-1,6-N-acetylglucosamine synthase-like glycosyltransferase